MITFRPLFIMGCLCVALPSVAKSQATFPIVPDTSEQEEGLAQSARTAETGAGEVGQRQMANTKQSISQPLGRLDMRIQNRVENRLRNRIDRDYDPMSNANSPFARAQRETANERDIKPR